MGEIMTHSFLKKRKKRLKWHRDQGAVKPFKFFFQTILPLPVDEERSKQFLNHIRTFFFLGLNNRRSNEILKDVDHLRINVAFRDISGDRSYAEFILVSYYSPSDHFIKVSSSTREGKVCSSYLRNR